MSDFEIKGLEKGTPPAHNRRMAGLYPLKVAVVSLDQKILTTQVPGEGMHRVKDCISFTLVCIPLLSRLRKTFGTEGNRLVGHCPIFGGKNLEKDGAHGMFTCIASDDPGQIVAWEVKLRGVLDTGFELLEMGFIVKSPLGTVPRKTVMGSFVQFGRPF